MSKYTVELRYLIENEKLYPPSDSDLALTNVLKNYPLYNGDVVNSLTNKKRRDELNEKIMNHYYFREIGFETVPMFLFKLQNKMNEIMKYYNQMYESVDFEFNPLWNVDMTETYEHTIDGTGTTTTTGTNTNTGSNDMTGTTTKTGTVRNVGTDTSESEGLNVESDTPQGGITESDILANTYASKTSHGNSTGTNTNDTTMTNNLSDGITQNIDISNVENIDGEISTIDNKTESFTRREFGSSKGYTFAQNIEQWRNIMINVDLQIVEELNELFMNVW